MNYQDLRIDFDYEIQQIMELSFTCGYGDHPCADLTAVVAEQEQDRLLGSIDSHTPFTIRTVQGRVLFTGYVSEVSFRLEKGLYLLHLTALGATAQMDILKRSRTFFKKGITYQKIIDFVLSAYPQASVLSHVDFDKETEFPMIQYQETDWEFLTRIASLFGAVLKSVETRNVPTVEVGCQKKNVAADIRIEDIETYRDVLTCEKEFYNRDDMSGASEYTYPDMLDYTWKAFTCGEYYPLGTMLRINGQELAVSYVEGYLHKGELQYDYVVRLPESVRVDYQENNGLAGASLVGTVRERAGNMVALALDIDQDDGIDNQGDDYFFTYAVETKDFYCMPVEDARVHLYFPTGKEWEAIAVHSLRNTSQGAQRAGYTANPSDRSLSNDTGSAIHLTPDAITMSPDDGQTVQVKLGSDGKIEIKGTDFWITGQDIVIGNGERITISAKDTLFISEMTGNKEGMTPVEDHFIAARGVTQLYATNHISHNTQGAARPVTPVYDDTELLRQEAQQAAQQNQQIADTLIARNREARAKFGKGLLMAALGTALIVCTGGAAAVVVGAALCTFAAADMSEATQSHELAMSGDWSTQAENFLKDVIPEPAYSMIENGLIIAGSILFAGPALAGKALMGAGINTGVEMAFDLIPDGKLDKSPMDYLNSFATSMMVFSLMGPLMTMEGCASPWATFGRQYASGVASSTMYGIAQGDLSIKGLAGNFVREGLSAGLAAKVGFSMNGKNKWLVAGVDTASDTLFDSAVQVWNIATGNQDSFDWQRCAQTALTSGINNCIMACDPVNAARGNLLVYKADLIFRGLYGEETWFRRYDSMLDYAGAFGKGWMHTFESFLFANRTGQQTDDWQITVMLPDTHKELFRYHDGEWHPQSDKAPYELKVKTEGGFLLTDRTQGAYIAYYYDKKGRLTAIQSHQHCEPVRIIYVEKEEEAPEFTRSRIDHVEYPGGQRLDFVYRERLVTSVTDHAGRQVTYHYESGRLMYVKYPTGGCQEYSYDEQGHITELKGEDGREFMRNEYDRRGRVTAQYYPDGTNCQITYDDKEWKTTFRYSDTGREEVNYYNAKYEITRREFGDGICEAMGYDTYGNRISHTDRNGNVTTWQYDSKGLLIHECSPMGLETEYTYDEQGRKIQEKDNEGGCKMFSYDTRGYLAEESVLIKEGYYCTTAYSRDEYGRILSLTDAAGNMTQYSYEEPIDSPTEVTMPEGYLYRYTYDKVGRRTRIITDYGTKEICYSETDMVSMETDALGNHTRYYLDSTGNILKVIRPNQYDEGRDNGSGTYYEYDYLDRPVFTRYPDGSVQKKILDMDGNVLRENLYAVSADTADDLMTAYGYDKRQYRIRELAPDGGVTCYERDNNGNLLKVIRPETYAAEGSHGRGIHYTYDADNRLTAILDEQDREFRRFLYDKKGRLIRQMEGGSQYGTRYDYDLAGRLIQKWTPVREDGEGALYNVTCYRYDAVGNCILERRSCDEVREGGTPVHYLDIRRWYDRQNRLVHVEDGLGAEAEYTYDCLNNRLTERYRVNEYSYRLICYKYDAAGRLSERMESVEAQNVGQTASRYSRRAFLRTRYCYDGNGNLTEIVLPLGGRIHREYDVLDRLLRERVLDEKTGTDTCVTFSYDAAGRVISRTEQDGDIRYYDYDRCGRLLRERDGEGGVTRYFHNRNGELVKIVDADNYDAASDDGAGYTFTYDEMGRTDTVRDAMGVLCEANIYDTTGNITGRYDSLGMLARYGYDLGGRQTAVYTGMDNSPVRTSTYDSLGNITSTVDGEGNRTDFELDAWGRITGITCPDGSRETYTYDAAGNITSATDGNGNVTRYAYNSMMKVGEVTDQSGSSDMFTYDAEGNRATHTDRNGRLVHREYASFGRLLYEEGEDGTFRRMRYDAGGRVTGRASNHVEYRYDYTKGGRLKTKYLNGRPVLGYTYTKAGRVASITDICGITTHYSYDVNGRLTAVSEKGRTLAAYTYDTAGRVEGIRYANGMQTRYSYDTDRNLALLETVDRDGQCLFSYSYHYDHNGNRTRKEDRKNGTATTYLYDPMQRLGEAEYPGTGKETYSYDGAGNRIRKQTQDYVEDYLYDECSRLKWKSKRYMEDNGTGEDITTYSYDRQGSLTGEESADSCRKYLYNDIHQCIVTEIIRGREEQAEKLVQQNLYDGEGLRFGMVENGRQTGFITDGWDNLTEIDGNGMVARRLIRGMGIVASEDAGAYHYCHGNERMDVEAITDEAGNVRNHYTYDAFGGIMDAEETIRNRYTYNGEAYDGVTGQYYLRKRYYSPYISRFTQEDEYRGDGLNLYAFCANNPVMYVDPSGYKKKKCGIGEEKDKNSNGKKAVFRENDSIEQYVMKAGNAKAMEVLNTQSKKNAGPCLSTVYDPVLDELYYGQNYKSRNKFAEQEYLKWIENDADPIIQRRKEEYQRDIDTGKVNDLPENHDPRLAAHSEVRAVDNALRARRKAGLAVNEVSITEMYLYNIDLRELYKGNGFVPKDRCINCSRITNGIITIGHK